MAEINDTIELTLPSGKKAVIRNYTTHGDDLKAEAELNKGMTVETGPDGQPRIQISAEAANASQRKYVELLVQSIDGETSFNLEQLRSEDYGAIEQAVAQITSVPKG